MYICICTYIYLPFELIWTKPRVTERLYLAHMHIVYVYTHISTHVPYIHHKCVVYLQLILVGSRGLTGIICRCFFSEAWLPKKLRNRSGGVPTWWDGNRFRPQGAIGLGWSHRKFSLWMGILVGEVWVSWSFWLWLKQVEVVYPYGEGWNVFLEKVVEVLTLKGMTLGYMLIPSKQLNALFSSKVVVALVYPNQQDTGEQLKHWLSHVLEPSTFCVKPTYLEEMCWTKPLVMWEFAISTHLPSQTGVTSPHQSLHFLLLRKSCLKSHSFCVTTDYVTISPSPKPSVTWNLYRFCLHTPEPNGKKTAENATKNPSAKHQSCGLGPISPQNERHLLSRRPCADATCTWFSHRLESNRTVSFFGALPHWFGHQILGPPTHL